MHDYQREWLDDPDVRPPDLGDVRFRCAEDVVAHAAVDPTFGWRTWPEVWHLDPDGALTCGYNASTMCTLVGWADDPSPLRRSRSEGLADPRSDCGEDWLIIDSRPVWMGDLRPSVSESDARAFLILRTELHEIGVRLLDAVVFDDAGHWWSLHELTSGTTNWRRPAENAG